MNAIQKIYLKRCLQPGIKGVEARRMLERDWRFYSVLRLVPFYGIMFRAVTPTIEEVEEELAKQRKGIKI